MVCERAIPTEAQRGFWSRLLTAALLVFAVLSFASQSFASSSYPNRVKSRWGISGKMAGAGADGCLLCHSKEAGGAGTATRSFAVALRTKYGLAGADIDSLDAALAQSKKNENDSDRDSFSDYEELATFGTDPNDVKSHPTVVEPGAGGAGGAPSSNGGNTNAVGAASGAGGSPEELEPTQCAPSGPSFPIAEHGCQFGLRSPRESGWFLAGLAALAVSRSQRLRRARRAGRDR